jgi:hypothetical protein
MFAHVHATGKGYFAHAGSWVELANVDSSGNLVVSGSITADSFVGVVTSTVIANPTNSLGANIPVGVASSSTFSATPGVSGSTIASFTYTVEGGSETTVSASNNSATVTHPVPTGSVGDDFVVTVFATDNLGNVSGTFTQTSTLVDVLVATPVLTVTQTSYTTSSYSASLAQATTHASTNWQISTVSDFSTIVEESLLDTSNLESYTPSFTGVIGTTYYVRAQHVDANDVSSEYSTVASYTQAAIGETSYTTPGTYTFTIPAGVTSISAVCVGGGGGGTGDHDGGGGCAGALGYKNNIAVTPGASWTVTVGDRGLGGTTDNGYGNNGSESRFLDPSNLTVVSAQGGIRGFPNTDSTVASKASFVGDGGGRGGNQPGQATVQRTGGAGAGGYNGDGASPPGYNVAAAQPASGSGAGGHGGSNNNWLQGGGGGVGILGIGADGISYGQVQDPLGNYGSYNRGRSGGGGSGGSDGVWSATRGNGGAYGAGGGGSYSGVYTGGHGGVGAVRIIWGPGRSFPSNAT